MAPITNSKLIYREIPTGYPEPGKTTFLNNSESIDIEKVELESGSILIKALVFAIDPYVRAWMRDPTSVSRVPVYEFGKPIHVEGIGRVVKSANSQFTVGDHVYGHMDMAEYVLRQDAQKGGPFGFEVLQNPHDLPLSFFAGAAGLPGRTAFVGWKEHSNAKKGEVAFVNAGAGAVGSMVVQLAKRDGLKVIASAGSDAKVEVLKNLGVDVAFNYKTTSTHEVLSKEGPVDVFWDNVGGPVIDDVLVNASDHARFIECGMVSGYNDAAAAPTLKNLFEITIRSIRILGFTVWDLTPKHGQEFNDLIPSLLSTGEFVYAEDRRMGLKSAEQAIVDVQKGANMGKCVIIVADD